MIACELGRIEVVKALIDHFDNVRKAKEQKQKEKLKAKK
jgi:hypothetical protein